MFNRCILVCAAVILLLSAAACGAPSVEPPVEQHDGKFNEERHQYAYFDFGVTNPVDSYPSESETTGRARREDIVFYAASLYEARRNITDRDIRFGLFIENLSDRAYIIERRRMDCIVLEMKHGGEWINIEYRHINAGMIKGLSKNINKVFLNGPLAAGRYRIRFQMRVFDIPGNIDLQYEFDVIAHEDAPEPKWDISRLEPSPRDASDQSAGVRMSITNPVLDRDNTTLEILLSADRHYTYGDIYEAEVLLEGKWYTVPFVSRESHLVAYNIWPDAGAAVSHNVVYRIGVVPAGQYRLIKTFDILEPAPTGGRYNVRVREIAMAEFTVRETLE